MSQAQNWKKALLWYPRQGFRIELPHVTTEESVDIYSRFPWPILTVYSFVAFCGPYSESLTVKSLKSACWSCISATMAPLPVYLEYACHIVERNRTLHCHHPSEHQRYGSADGSSLSGSLWPGGFQHKSWRLHHDEVILAVAQEERDSPGSEGSEGSSDVHLHPLVTAHSLPFPLPFRPISSLGLSGTVWCSTPQSADLGVRAPLCRPLWPLWSPVVNQISFLRNLMILISWWCHCVIVMLWLLWSFSASHDMSIFQKIFRRPGVRLLPSKGMMRPTERGWLRLGPGGDDEIWVTHWRMDLSKMQHFVNSTHNISYYDMTYIYIYTYIYIMICESYVCNNNTISCWHHVHIFDGRSEAHWESNHRLAIWRKPTHWNLSGACALWQQPLGRKKKQVDIDGLKSTVSSRKKEAFGSALESLQLCFDSGPMAVSSIIGHVGGIHVL